MLLNTRIFDWIYLRNTWCNQQSYEGYKTNPYLRIFDEDTIGYGEMCNPNQQILTIWFGFVWNFGIAQVVAIVRSYRGYDDHPEDLQIRQTLK